MSPNPGSTSIGSSRGSCAIQGIALTRLSSRLLSWQKTQMATADFVCPADLFCLGPRSSVTSNEKTELTWESITALMAPVLTTLNCYTDKQLQYCRGHKSAASVIALTRPHDFVQLPSCLPAGLLACLEFSPFMTVRIGPAGQV
jgi:hypothetical protein